MAELLKIKVIDAGQIPRCEWRMGRHGPEDARWVVADKHTEDTPPRVLLEVSEEAARKLAAHYGEEITIEIKESS